MLTHDRVFGNILFIASFIWKISGQYQYNKLLNECD